MNILGTIKSYINIVIGVLSAMFLAWVYYLKKSNDSKEQEIDSLEKEILIKEEVHKAEKDVAEFKGSLNVLDEALEIKKEQSDIEYKKAVKNEKTNTPTNTYTFT